MKAIENIQQQIEKVRAEYERQINSLIHERDEFEIKDLEEFKVKLLKLEGEGWHFNSIPLDDLEEGQIIYVDKMILTRLRRSFCLDYPITVATHDICKIIPVE